MENEKLRRRQQQQQQQQQSHFNSSVISATNGRQRSPGRKGDSHGTGNDYTKVDLDHDDVKRQMRLHQYTERSNSLHSSEPINVREIVSRYMAPVIYTLLSVFTRYYQIGASNTVVWDEAHFGKFGSHYLKREFYFDVHPPLGKMLVGLAGLLAGYDGSFEFKSGETYPDGLNYTFMRIFLASFGAAIVPLAWATARELGLDRRAMHLVTLMVLLDNALLTISRFILLDSMLMYFTVATAFALVKFHNQQHQPFEKRWWTWLSICGLCIGCVTSVKWVGLFVTTLVGFYTIEDLWDKFGDLKMPKRTYIRHWAARIMCLIMLPAMVYISSFKIHFLILDHSGPGDAQMSSLFQANLRGNNFGENPLEIAYGSTITLKNMGYGGGLLHSHIQTYPVGSEQQQVTCYHYKDENNEWLIKPVREDTTWDENDENVRYLQEKEPFRMFHVSTGRNLHSHAVAAPVTKLNNEVSCYGNDTLGDSNDYFQFEIVDDMMVKKPTRIRSLTTRLRLRHVNSGCYIRADNTVLPQWGFKQVEVSCDKTNKPKDEHTYWNVETHKNEYLPPGEAKLYRSPFFRDFWHLNIAMMTSNNALVPDPDKEDILASRPRHWPFLAVGLRMCGWGDEQIKFYLLGNPVVWWSGIAAIFASVSMVGWYILRAQRKYTDLSADEWSTFTWRVKLAFGGWLLHYFPFCLMGRVTYLHHYFPALYFAILAVGVMSDHMMQYRSGLVKKIYYGLLYVSTILIFIWFRAITFGVHGPIAEYQGRTWRDSWNLVEEKHDEPLF